ncbi:MAG: RNA-binding domain-containing protein [Candidatus Bathyarchaeia archaeon]
MAEVTIHVEAEVNPTESEEKIKAAINNILGNAIITIEPTEKSSLLTGEAKGQDSLIKLRNMLRSDRIRDAARKALFRSTKGENIVFCLNRQVAFAGHVSFSEETGESPLGTIRVTITSDNPSQLIEWLAEKSRREEG